MITVHEENHIGVECVRLNKYELAMAQFATLDEFEEHCKSGFYQSHDCDGMYACLDSHGNKYVGGYIRFDQPDGSLIRVPSWCTHIYWSSK